MANFFSLSKTWTTALISSLALFGTLIPSAQAAAGDTIQGLNADGTTQTLLVDRYPALYTGDFGDCMGGQSLINLTSFDAAYYADNMTVLFNLAGTSNLKNESLIIYISVEAYGEDRFDLTFNPCSANFASLCPLNSSVPITGGAVIPVSKSDVSAIPPIALSIPDFEGSAIMRIFSNTTKTQIGCFQAVMRNGASFSHPAAIGSALGGFAFIALVASFATAIYGVSVPHIRTHYAHSLSVLVVFEVYQSIFFSGALSLNWPSVLAAFWSNFAWSAGMINLPAITRAVENFVGIAGTAGQVGGAGSTPLKNNGGLQQQIYGREVAGLAQRGEELAGMLYKRAVNETGNSRQYEWAGFPVSPGLPIPGNWSGFGGELAMVGIPAPNAFLTGFIWLLILVSVLVVAVASFKWSLEGLSAVKLIKNDRLALFRSHWLGFTGLAVLRTVFIAFFMIMTLTLFQFSSGGRAGVIAIAVIVFVAFFAGVLGVAFYACFYRIRFGRYQSSPDRIHFQRKKALKFLPWYTTKRESELDDEEKTQTAGSVSFFKIDFVGQDAEEQNVHENSEYTKRFGWLSARYRRTRWWFFAFWVVYQFVRACFIGGARASPTAQVFGIFVWETLAFVAIVIIRPFEGARNTALAVYMLGISKVVTSALSIAFLPQFNVARIPTTVIGVIIIVVQGFLVIALMILIVLGAISSYMSLTRNREEIKPHHLTNIRMKYFAHLENKEKDLPPPPPPIPEVMKEPYFSVNTVLRAPKIEDEDGDAVPDMNEANPSASMASFHGATRASRTNSMRSHYSTYGSVPFGARVHRASWSSRDFQNWQENGGEINRGESPYSRVESPFVAPSRGGSANHTTNNSISAPLFQPSPSAASLRPATPTREQQRRHNSGQHSTENTQ